jgi:integrase
MKRRQTLYAYGRRGDRVRVLVDANRDRVEVLFRDVDGIARKRVWANDKQGRTEAVAWADLFKVERERAREERNDPKPKPITLRALWRAYRESPDWTTLRAATQVSYANRWRRWELLMRRDFVAGSLTLIDIDRFIKAAQDAGIVSNQIRQVLNVANIVYRWGQSRRLIATNDFALYRWKQPRDAVVLAPGQYAGAEWDRLIEKTEPQHSKRWRLNVALLLIGASGQRANAVRHLRWQDIDTEAGTVRWVAAFQKQGKDLLRPLTWDLVAALETARYWRRQAGERRARKDRKSKSWPVHLDNADWVMFAEHQKAKPVSYQSLHTMLVALQKKAKVTHEKFRAFHGGRRKVVTDVIRETGDRMLGLEYVGDTDPKMLARYDKGLEERLGKAVRAVEETVPESFPNEKSSGRADAND